MTARVPSRRGRLCQWLAPALALAAHAQAAEIPASASRMSRSWTTEDGLPQASVQAVTQTADGYLWIGTQQGLARFDGMRFEVFGRSDAGPILHSVTTLHPARSGGLWIGTRWGGLHRFEGGTLMRVALPSATVLALQESADGRLWVGTETGLECVAAGAGASCARFGFGAEPIHALHEDAEGLWIGASSGLYRFGRDGLGPAVVAGPIRALGASREGGLWVGTERGGVVRLVNGRAANVGPPGLHVRSLLEDRDGVVWLATDGGLRTLRGGRFESAGLSSRLHTVFEDREGTLWVGARYDGLTRLTRPSVSVRGARPDGSHPTVLSVHEDRRGRIWFGTAGAGLGRHHGGETAFFARGSGLSGDIVGPVIETRDGALWFGDRSFPLLHRWRNGQRTTLRLARSAASLFEDRDGTLWIGTTGAGLYRWRAHALEPWLRSERLPSGTIRAIDADGDGGLWLGTSAGLVRLRGPDHRVSAVVQELAGHRVSALYPEPAGPLWLATFPGALVRLAGDRVTRYGLREGLCDDVIHAILDDGRGGLWLGSNRGILQVPKAQLEELAAGTRDRVSCTAYGRADGLEGAECHGGYQPSAIRGRDGRLWFATLKGLAVIDPSRLAPLNPLPPPVVIEGARIDGRALPAGRFARLPPGTRRLEIAYTALSLVAPEKVRFRHRLLGFDSDWVEAGTQRTASYTTLPPGDYTFEVLACNNDGVWSERSASWGLRLEPYFHQTGWFLAALALAAVGLAWALHVLRARGWRLRNALLTERARLSREVHDSVSQIMTGVILQLDGAAATVTQGPGACRPYLERAMQLAQQGIEETRRILRGLPESILARKGLARALLRRALPLVEGTSIQLRVKEEGQPVTLPTEVEGDLFQIGQEAVTNALRHGQPRAIDVVVSYARSGVGLSVCDDGAGFEPADRGESGLGLAGIERRVAERHGTLQVRSRPGAGTTVAVFLPIGRAEG